MHDVESKDDNYRFFRQIAAKPFKAVHHQLMAAYFVALGGKCEAPEVIFRTSQFVGMANVKDATNICKKLGDATDPLYSRVALSTQEHAPNEIPAFRSSFYNTNVGSFMLQLDYRLIHQVEPGYQKLYDMGLFHQILKLRNVHDMRFLYALAMEMEHHPRALTFTVEQLRSILLTKAKIHKFPKFGDFNRRILKPVIERINQDSDWTLAETYVKSEGKKVGSVVFVLGVKKNRKQLMTSSIKQLEFARTQAFSLLTQFGVAPKTASDRVGELSSIYAKPQELCAYIESAIAYTRSKNLKGHRPQIPYLLKTLSENYHGFDLHEYRQSIKREQQGKEQKVIQQRKALLAQRDELVTLYQEQRYTEFVSSLPEPELKSILKAVNELPQVKSLYSLMGSITVENHSSSSRRVHVMGYLEKMGLLTQADCQPTYHELVSLAADQGIDYGKLLQELEGNASGKLAA